jgi:DASH complex subunit DAM1
VPAGLAFLPPALAELADEAESLHASAQGLLQLSKSLSAFNEAFASWLYIMDMNALTVEWSQVRCAA